MGSRRGWRFRTAAGLIAGTLILTGCGDDGDNGVETETETETEVEIPEVETETEIPGVDAPEVEVDP